MLSLGYDRTADYWAFGCLLYELFFGKNPFDHSGNLKATFVAVASIGLGKTTISFPPEAAGTNEWVEDLLQRLLVCKSRRIVSPHLFGHPFLESLDINQLRRKEIVAPFRPVLQSSTDTSASPCPPLKILSRPPSSGHWSPTVRGRGVDHNEVFTAPRGGAGGGRPPLSFMGALVGILPQPDLAVIAS